MGNLCECLGREKGKNESSDKLAGPSAGWAEGDISTLNPSGDPETSERVPPPIAHRTAPLPDYTGAGGSNVNSPMPQKQTISKTEAVDQWEHSSLLQLPAAAEPMTGMGGTPVADDWGAPPGAVRRIDIGHEGFTNVDATRGVEQTDNRNLSSQNRSFESVGETTGEAGYNWGGMLGAAMNVIGLTEDETSAPAGPQKFGPQLAIPTLSNGQEGAPPFHSARSDVTSRTNDTHLPVWGFYS